jgi:hypothetical protein
MICLQNFHISENNIINVKVAKVLQDQKNEHNWVLQL